MVVCFFLSLHLRSCAGTCSLTQLHLVSYGPDRVMARWSCCRMHVRTRGLVVASTYLCLTSRRSPLILLSCDAIRSSARLSKPNCDTSIGRDDGCRKKDGARASPPFTLVGDDHRAGAANRSPAENVCGCFDLLCEILRSGPRIRLLGRTEVGGRRDGEEKAGLTDHTRCRPF
jgi:hypothetical protein